MVGDLRADKVTDMGITDFLVAAGIATLSGMGVGSGGLLVVYLTLIAGVPQITAQGINLFYFLFAAGASCAVNIRKRNVAWGSVLLLSAGGAAGAVAGAVLASVMDPSAARLIFGAFLVVTGGPAFVRALQTFLPEKSREKQK